jgi:exodeoxyribonuclease VII large subunit
MADPQKLLEKGYSITYHNGKVVKSICSVAAGDTLVTRLSDGSLSSTVNAPATSD